MKRFVLLALAAALLLSGCGKKEAAKTNTAATNSTASGNPITAPVDYLGAVGQAKKFSEKTIDTVSLKQAIDLFYTEEERFPKDLNELVTKRYLPSLPKPPYGMKFQYDAQTGQIKVVKAQ